VYVINLARSKERLSEIEQHLNQLNLNFTVIEAVDGNSLSIDDMSKYYDENKNSENYHKKLNKGEVACYLSHRKVWQNMIDDCEPFALILEDDAHLNEQINKTLKIIESSNVIWDVIKLYSGKKKKKIVNSINLVGPHKLVKTYKVPTTNLAQIVSFAGANKLLNMASGIGVPLDVDMQRWWLHDLNILGIYPDLASPTEAESEINAIGKRGIVKYSKFKKWKQKFKYEINLLIYKNPLKLSEFFK